MAFPENEAEADLIWQKRLTNDLIEEQLAEMRRAEEKKPGSSTYLEKKNPQDEVSVNKVLKFYQRYQDTLRQIGPEEICTRFLSAVCHTFDPHSDYLSAPEGEDFMNDMRKHLVGIGIRFSKNEGHAEVESIIVNGPAHRSGAIHPKDRILKVGQGVTGDLTSVEGLDSNKIADKIRGEPGSVVRLEILPQNDASQLPVVVTLRREKVDLLESRAKADLIVSAGPDGKPSKVGWISIDNFYGDPENNTVSLTEDVSRLLDRLQQEKVEGLVIDLRNNPGGYLEEAVSLAGLFMDRGPVVQERDAKGRAFPKSSRPARAKYAGPLVVVTDRSSASASEIFAACIQDRRRGVVVGEAATFGKGTVQTVMQVAEHLPTNIPAARAGTLKLTIRKFYRVAGGSTQLKGVVPDIILPSRTETTTFGEEALPGALAFDTIPQLTYQPSPALPLFELRLKAEKRLEQDREFAYIRQDFEKIRQQALQNSISLNRTDRVAEWKEKIAQTRLRKQERAAVADKIKAEAKVYRLTTENYHKPELFPLAKALEIASGAEIVQKDIFADRPEDFPNLMEPVRVESLSILRDLIGLAKSAETAQREPSAAKPSGG
jgi:carboxyl-terminal processing protease